MRSSFAVFLRGFTLPFGVTTGRRLFLDGVNGLIAWFDAANNQRITIGGASSPSRILLSTGAAGEAFEGLVDTFQVATDGGAYGVLLQSPSSDGTLDAVALLSLRSRTEGGAQEPRILMDDANGNRLGLVQLRTDQLQVSDGANLVMGTAVLVAGAVVVNHSRVQANSRIFLTSQADGGTPGFLRITARVAGTSFTITSSNAADTSTVAWLLLNPS